MLSTLTVENVKFNLMKAAESQVVGEQEEQENEVEAVEHGTS